MGLVTLSHGETVSPSEKEKKEILTINGKRRTYYQIHENNLTYEIKGPKRLEVVSRRAVPKMDKKKKKYGYYLILDNNDTINVDHKERISKVVQSTLHPGHGYTKSGSYFLNIPSGHHQVTLTPLGKRSSPVLVRVLTTRFEKAEKEGKFIHPINETELVHLKGPSRKLRYYRLSEGEKIEFDFSQFSNVLILSRLAFENWMSSDESYRLRIKKDSKVEGTYFFLTEKSSKSTIIENKEVVPGLRRTCEIENPAEGKPYFVEVLDKGKMVYIRCIGYE
tara:strand:+ start:11258 stop:12091 length:834 start_codon:yes stop_codon:yes gene_type:complete